MNTRIKKFLAPVASLRLTVALLILSIGLILAGTLAQRFTGIWTVQKQYFHSFWTWIDFYLFTPERLHVRGAIPWPGGYTLIVLLLANLLSAHAIRFKLNWKRSGILLIHFGLILLLGGEVVTSLMASEGQMVLTPGSTLHYAQDIRAAELAVVDPSPADHDNVTVVSDALLKRKGTVHDARLPFDVRVDEYFPNSDILGPFQARQAGVTEKPLANAGSGVGVVVVGHAPFTGAGDDAEKVDVPSAYVTLLSDGMPLGTYLVSVAVDQPQKVTAGGRTYELALRFKRYCKPYTITLLKFTHDTYIGTDTAKNFASRVRLLDPANNVDREVLIWMNHPLRYAGDTFYQQSFLKGDQGTVLQIVRNPGQAVPYIACILGAAGMVIHFGMNLVTFLRRTWNNLPAEPFDWRVMRWPAAVAGLCVVYLLDVGIPHKAHSDFDLNGFARVPVTYEGRVMPMDTLARNSLTILCGHERFTDERGRSVSAVQWLLGVMSDAPGAGDQRVFTIDHPDLLGLLNLDPKRRLFSRAELEPSTAKLAEQVQRAADVPSGSRDALQRQVLELAEHRNLYDRLHDLSSLLVVPPASSQNPDDWRSLAQVVNGLQSGGEVPAAARSFVTLIDDYHHNDSAHFNQTVAQYNDSIAQAWPKVESRLKAEFLFNYAAPFKQCMVMYVGVFLLACASWIWTKRPLWRAAYALLIVTAIVHSVGLGTRIYIQGRPPVTNLYSSALFIGWGCVMFCVALEAIYRMGLGAAVASVAGFVTLLIGLYLSGSGDTMQMLQAVLDTNIWLATHVVVITLGYAATFLAGLFAITYVVTGIFTDRVERDPQLGKMLTRIVYAIVCFATLFSFVGTILGGIWADQSWGRFWGWDPKENGAVLIVLWNAVILHARWGGLVKQRGVMMLAIFGNIVTSWSWFGTNMLGVGLHSYGWMASAALWLSAFMISQVALIGLAMVPFSAWASLRARRQEPLFAPLPPPLPAKI